MAHIVTLRGVTPKIGNNCFLAETAVIIGDVEIGDNCSIWFGAVLRGDVNKIRIGNGVNIQDNAVIHTLYKRSQSIIGNNVSVGHNANIHGAIIDDGVLVGMGATVLDNAHIAENCLVAANSLVLTNAQLESASIYAGVPAKLIKKLTVEQIQAITLKTANDYQMYASWYQDPNTKTEQRIQ